MYIEFNMNIILNFKEDRLLYIYVGYFRYIEILVVLIF